ncbi:MAG: hypothetical protein MUF87_12130 [Anaerolineae bacterium]|jgi:hypothetical protein|nr:hypothetical protein [Anaerolineae bacterium]
MIGISANFQQKLPLRQLCLEAVCALVILLIASLPFGFLIQPWTRNTVLLPILAALTLLLYIGITFRTVTFALRSAHELMFDRALLLLIGFTPLQLILNYTNIVFRRVFVSYLILGILRFGLAYMLANYLWLFGFLESDLVLQIYTYSNVYPYMLHSKLAGLPQLFVAGLILWISLCLEAYALILLSLLITLLVRASMRFRLVVVMLIRIVLILISFAVIAWSASLFNPLYFSVHYFMPSDERPPQVFTFCKTFDDPEPCHKNSLWFWRFTHTIHMALFHTIDQGLMNAADLMRPDFRRFDLQRDLSLNMYYQGSTFIYNPMLRPLLRNIVGTALGICIYLMMIGGLLFAIRRSILRVP